MYRHYRLFALFLLVCFAGCTSGASDASGNHKKQHSAKQQGTQSAAKKPRIGLILAPRGLGDRSFNDMQYNGLIDAYRTYDIEAFYRTIPDFKHSSYAKTLDLLINKDKCDMIFAIEGFGMGELVNKIAAKNPQTLFIMMDYSGPRKKNIIECSFAQNEGAFVIGYLMANFSKSGKIAMLGGCRTTGLLRFETGFKAGIRYSGKQVKTSITYLTRLPDLSGFAKPHLAYSNAMQLYRNGYDVIFAVAGLSGNGVIRAAEQSGKYAVGVDSDQDLLAPGHVLTSMMKRMDVAVKIMIKKFISGELKGGQQYYFDYRAGGISLTEMKYTRKLISKTLLKKLRRIEYLIWTGRLKVPGRPLNLKNPSNL